MEKIVSAACDSAYHACPFLLLLPIEKDDNWLLVVGGAVGIQKYDFNDGVSLMFPFSPN